MTDGTTLFGIHILHRMSVSEYSHLMHNNPVRTVNRSHLDIQNVMSALLSEISDHFGLGVSDSFRCRTYPIDSSFSCACLDFSVVNILSGSGFCLACSGLFALRPRLPLKLDEDFVHCQFHHEQ